MPKLSQFIAQPGQAVDHDKLLAQLQATNPHLLREATVRGAIVEACNAYVTRHAPTLETLTSARRLATLNDPVLIYGPTGTGKELIAAILHAPRGFQRHRMVAFNCAGFQDTLFESELFGHKKGAYTGAHVDKPGLLRDAAEGTVFFDEVGELPLTQQAKLLRVLQTKRIRGVGQSAEDETDMRARCIFATNRDIPAMIRAGTFRADLFYRISKFVLETYPLADRPDDIMPIVDRICELNGWAKEFALPPVEAYSSGNVRQLENYIARLAVLSVEPSEALKNLGHSTASNNA